MAKKLEMFMSTRAQVARAYLFDGCLFSFTTLALLSLFTASNEILDLSSASVNFIILFLIGVASSFYLPQKQRPSLGRKIFDPAFSQGPSGGAWKGQIFLSAIVFLSAAVKHTQFSFYEIFDPNGLQAAGGLFRGLLSPDFSLLSVAITQVIQTVYIALLATVLAVPVSFLLAFFAAKNIMNSSSVFWIYALLRTFLNVVRSVEPIIWAVVFAVWVGVGPFAGMLALMVQSIASLTKQYSELIESVSEGPLDGIRATGANQVQTVWYAILPQVILPYVSFTIYRWDINVRMATIIGFAGGGGIGTLLYQYSMRSQWPEVGCIIAVIAAVVWLMDITSAYIREALK